MTAQLTHIITQLEDRALTMLTELLNMGPDFQGRIFTTGATGSNTLGLACGREFVVNKRLQDTNQEGGVGELGLLKACLLAGINEIQVLTTMGHSSLYKAASIVGIGRQSVKDIPESAQEPWKLNFGLLEKELREGSSKGVVSIVAVSAGEVNTGCFATTGKEDMQRLRGLCDEYGAWLHVDGGMYTDYV